MEKYLHICVSLRLLLIKYLKYYFHHYHSIITVVFVVVIILPFTPWSSSSSSSSSSHRQQKSRFTSPVYEGISRKELAEHLIVNQIVLNVRMLSHRCYCLQRIREYMRLIRNVYRRKINTTANLCSYIFHL